MKNDIVYRVSHEFSRFPGGRKRRHGEFSGEAFREDVVLPMLTEHEFITFDLSGSAGYSSGFLDEAFGELGSIFGLTELKRRITILCADDEDAVETAWERIQDAATEARKE